MNNLEVEKEFKWWMDVKSGNKIVVDLVPDSEVMTFGEYKLQINIEYDDEELTQSKLGSVKNAIESTIKVLIQHLALIILSLSTTHQIKLMF